jgi:hypothetical protein
MKEYRFKNKERLKEYKKGYYLKNKERRKECNKEYRLKNKERIAKLSKQYSLENKEKLKEYKKRWFQEDYSKNKEKYLQRSKKNYIKRKVYHNKWMSEYSKRPEIKERRREWSRNWCSRPENKERRKEYMKGYNLKNRERIQEYKKKYRSSAEGKKRIREGLLKKLRTDPAFKLIRKIRTSVGHILKPYRKSMPTLQLLGVPNVEFLWNHLEKQFQPGMTRENHGKWHIDHIIPIDYYKKNFDLNKSEIQQKCFHYTNLQPLWAFDNMSKGAKIQ